MMRVPLLDLRAQYAAIRDEVLATVGEVLESQQFILGARVEEFEKAMAGYVGVANAVGMSSGTDALTVAFMALGLRPGDCVLTPAYSFFATAGVLARLHAVPVFVDIDPATFNMSGADLEKRWNDLDRAARARVKAILPVHLFGQCADMTAILALGREVGVPVIEDAAQAIGATSVDGRRVGSLGVMGCLSFFPSKNLGGIGDGGMVVTEDDALAERLRILRNHGASPKYHHRVIGGNFRLDALQAAVLAVKLRHLDGWIKARRMCAERYRSLFDENGLADGGPVTLPVVRHLNGPHPHTFNQYVVRVPARDELRAFLAAEGIGTEVYYPLPLHLQECFRDLGYRPGDFPHSERASGETLALPIYPELTLEQQAYVVERIAMFYGGAGR